jgi:hypothetical protein
MLDLIAFSDEIEEGGELIDGHPSDSIDHGRSQQSLFLASKVNEFLSYNVFDKVFQFSECSSHNRSNKIVVFVRVSKIR